MLSTKLAEAIPVGQIISGAFIACVVLVLVAIGIFMLPTIMKNTLGCSEEEWYIRTDIVIYCSVVIVGLLIYILGYRSAAASYVVSVILISIWALRSDKRYEKNNTLSIS